jgi:O-antigen/teichoic acid export membrane protein
MERVSIASAYQMLRESLPFALHNIISPLFNTIDVLLLSLLSTFEAVGTYNAAYRLIVVMQIVPEALNRAIFARLSRLYWTSAADFKTQLDQACRYMLILGVATSAALIVMSHKIVTLLFTGDYSDSVGILCVLALSLPVYFLRVVLSAALYANGKERIAIIIYACSTIADATIDFALIPRFNAFGAALGSLGGEFLICLGYYITLKANRFSPNLMWPLIKTAIAASILALVAFACSRLPLHVQAGCSVIVYLGSVYFLGLITKEELLAGKKLILSAKLVFRA